MAYIDSNGLVLIDEIEATEDVKRLNLAIDSLNESLAIINHIEAINSSFKGYTSEAIETSIIELANCINNQKKAIEDQIAFINRTVDKYKSIDEKMKNQINSAMD